MVNPVIVKEQSDFGNPQASLEMIPFSNLFYNTKEKELLDFKKGADYADN